MISFDTDVNARPLGLDIIMYPGPIIQYMHMIYIWKSYYVSLLNLV